MGESTKAVCALLMIVGFVGAAIAWVADRPDAATWAFRIGGLVTACLALGVILKLHFRADLEQDYLRMLNGNYFNRDGFCFTITSTEIDGCAFVVLHFQSQFDRPSTGRVAIRPARGFFLTRAKIDSINFEIDCPPGGYGFTRIPIPIPVELQGKRQSFEIGASVQYPEGKGRRIRFHDGTFLRANTNFGDSFGTALMVAGAATGTVVLSRPATATIEMPQGVAEDIGEFNATDVQQKTLWKLGDAPLDAT